ncbi:contactin-2-like [Argonauta hians]
MLLKAVLLFITIKFTLALPNIGCPESWYDYKLHCYQIVSYPLVTFDSALAKCQENGAYLLKVTDTAEHDFIKKEVKKYFSDSTLWWTGGQRDTTERAIFNWFTDGSRVSDNPDYWLSPNEKSKPGSQVVYKKDGNRIGWSVAEKTSAHGYICEINQDETYRIMENRRGLDYGMEVQNKNDMKRGPMMAIEPQDTAFIPGTDKSVMIECLAKGNPTVKYKWYRGPLELSSETNNRYTVTNGRLKISNPSEEDNSDDYHCVAYNEIGSINSTSAQIAVAMLGEFTNIKPRDETAETYKYKIIQCPKISSKPGVRYQWTKDSVLNYIRTDKQQYIFSSSDGRLYFAEINSGDAGVYYCMVTLSGSGKFKLTSQQSPLRISKEITLNVLAGASKGNFGPQILNEFIKVYPSRPMLGDEVRMECFAIGTFRKPFDYKWYKDNGPLSSRVHLIDSNRVLIIKGAQLEDEGTYECVVTANIDGMKQDRKSLVFRLQSQPYFVMHLKSQLVEPNSKFTWRCLAEGRPSVTYSWFKDTKLLKSTSNVQINKNTLTILNTDPARDNGMYQCAAENENSLAFSTAELKVSSFAPKFIHYHLPPSTLGALNGKISFICNPDAIPKAEITWSKNGMDLGLTSGQSSGRIQKLLNGNLFISELSRSDAGEYKCTATNNLGSSSDSTRLEIVDRLTLVRKPSNKNVNVNETAFFYCSASYNADFEVVYKWYFNGHPIDVENDPYYREGNIQDQRGLYIQTAQLKHRGNYTCQVLSPLTVASASAYLTVKGPPREPSGVFGDRATEDRITIFWLAPYDNGYPITRYIVESSNKLNPEWKITSGVIPSSEVNNENVKFKSFRVMGLQPNNLYTFRVRALNKLGVSPPSLPSADYRTLSSPPKRAPYNVTGGGGKVGDLTITWTPIPPEEQGANGIGYRIYWRVKGNKNNKWSKHYIAGQAGDYHAFAGVNYYTLYEVKVQALNNRGPGPNSTISSIYSAEDLPRAVPIDVAADTYNSTALEVTWTPPVDNRETMRGKIRGYQINWLDADVEDPIRYSQSFYGAIEDAVIIGLKPNGYYWVTVQVFNTAGLGPLSERYYGATGMDAPLNFPTEVFVNSRDSTSVNVKFRGVGFGIDESPVAGYKLCYRSVREVWDLDHCKNIDAVEHGVIENLEKNVLYKLRVLAYSGDGDGKKSEAVYFTLGGQVVVDQATHSIMAGSSCLVSSLSVFILSYILYTIPTV